MRTTKRRAQRRPAASAPDRETDALPPRIESEAAPPSRPLGVAPELDALQRLALLSKEVQSWARDLANDTVTAIPAAASGMPAVGSPLFSRAAKTLVALALAAVLGWIPLQRLFQTTSAEATVNARLITLRAPIDGEIASSLSADAGAAVRPGDRILSIFNRRADRSRLDDLRRTIARIDGEAVALGQRLEQLAALQGDLRSQRDAFQRGRILQMQARVDEIAADIAAAEALNEDTAHALERASKLNESGFQSRAALQRAEREAKVAARSVEAARQRLVGANVELEAARRGVFVGDSYNDIPRSAQRVDELQQQIVEISSELQERKVRKSHLEAELVEERKRFADLSRADISAPAPGRVWEVLTAPGEDVRRGQELVRVLDCGGTVVTASVSEGAYNKLRIGGPASFHLRGERPEHKGRIVGLNGLATVSANLAIEQKALVREPYHVTIEVPDLAKAADCYVGRTGKVTFDTSAGGAAPPASTGP